MSGMYLNIRVPESIYCGGMHVGLKRGRPGRTKGKVKRGLTLLFPSCWLFDSYFRVECDGEVDVRCSDVLM